MIRMGLMALGVALAGPAFADRALAEKNACLACHATDRKLVGPSYQDVARKYGAQKDAQAALAASIRSGGVGRWGPIPMPAQATLSDEEARTLAAWILAGGR